MTDTDIELFPGQTAARNVLRAEVKRLIDRGWRVVRLRRGSKRAFTKDWPSLSLNADAFQYRENVGIAFGAASGMLHDVDLDLPTARMLVSHSCFELSHLPEFGRASLPAGQRGHRLVISPDAPGVLKVYGFRFKGAKELLGRLGIGNQTVIELRGSGGTQSAAPPSNIVDDNGVEDSIVWTGQAGADVAVPEMAWAALQSRAAVLATAAFTLALAAADAARGPRYIAKLYSLLREARCDEVDRVVDAVERTCGTPGATEALDGNLTGNAAIDCALRQWLGLESENHVANNAGWSNAGAIDAEDLERLLGCINPCDYAGYFAWRDLMFSAHHASGGSDAAREVFVHWSAENPEFASAEWSEQVRSAWRRASANRSGKVITIATLLRAVIDAGGEEIVSAVMRRHDFDAFDDVDAEPLDFDVPDPEPLDFTDGTA